jgi:hypothetical protein
MGVATFRLNGSRLVPVGTAPSTSLVLEHDNGSLFASLRYARVRKWRMEFALTVVNTSDQPVLAKTYALSNRNGDLPLGAFAFWVDARTEAYVHVPLDARSGMRSHALVVRIRGRGIDERVEARVPRPHLLWAIGGAVVAAAMLAAIAVFRPALGYLDVPRSAQADAMVNAQYAFRGFGHRVWELTDIGGAHVGGGELASSSGTLAVHLPAAKERKIYLLRLRADGAFGSASGDRVIVAETPRPH